MKRASKNGIMKMIKLTRRTYTEIFETIKIQNWNQPLKNSDDAELGILNPYSKISCFVV